MDAYSARPHPSVFLGFHAQDDKDAPEISASAFDSNGKRRLMSRAVAVNAPLREEGEVRNARFSRDVKLEEEEHAPVGGSRGARGPDGSELEVCCCQVKACGTWCMSLMCQAIRCVPLCSHPRHNFHIP